MMRQYVDLAPFSTFGIGGQAQYFISVETIEEAQKAILFAKNKGITFFILGKGSNCLFDDQGFAGLVILNRIRHLSIAEGNIRVGSGYSFSRLGMQTVAQNWAGLEFAGGIPATVGGAVYMNAGVRGQETCDTLQRVTFLDVMARKHVFSLEEMEFAYRYSSLQGQQGMIVEAEFSLYRDPDVRLRQQSMLASRKKTQPLQAKTCGCIFRNPSPSISAAMLIDQCLLKGYAIGNAIVSQKHANFIENQDGATAKDVLSLIHHVRTTVENHTGYRLDLEVCYVK